MKKIISGTIFKLLACLLMILLDQSCVKKNDGYEIPGDTCRRCTAIQGGVEIDHYDACTSADETRFRNTHPDATISCQ
ncbi:MAG: hypothetical protein JST75_18130 [Bacteroidetes bacterium]|nr:hypothetical protein [Bacteroidota bacterium]